MKVPFIMNTKDIARLEKIIKHDGVASVLKMIATIVEFEAFKLKVPNIELEMDRVRIIPMTNSAGDYVPLFNNAEVSSSHPKHLQAKVVGGQLELTPGDRCKRGIKVTVDGQSVAVDIVKPRKSKSVAIPVKVAS